MSPGASAGAKDLATALPESPSSRPAGERSSGRGPLRLASGRFCKRPAAVFGLIVIVLFVAAALLAPWISPYDPTRQSYSVIRKAPSALHWFGTDENGRDVLARVLFGARATMVAALVSVTIASGAGVPLGCSQDSRGDGSMR